MGNSIKTYGTPTELLKLDGLVASVGVRILSYTRSPFGIEFESESGRDYVVESTGDLRKWGVVKTYNGTGNRIRFEEERDQVFLQIYSRIRVVE